MSLRPLPPPRRLGDLARTLLRHLTRLLTCLVYRLDVEGVQHVPSKGPALLVANHLSYADAFVVACRLRRNPRFVMSHAMLDMPGLGWLFRLARVIPIAPAKENAAVKAEAFARIDAALAAGELVILFPEGRCTRDGRMDVFRPGMERVLAKRAAAGAPVPVIPIGLHGLFGSVFSFAHGAPMTTRPRRFRARVRVRFGAPLSPRVSAAEAREAVARLVARARFAPAARSLA
ncbi:MAG: 1-acyl-sn-glycerol-3-phosphate acyltransferase [Myxococcota bacterium]